MIGENPGPRVLSQPGRKWRAAGKRLRAVTVARLSHNVLFTPRIASHFSTYFQTEKKAFYNDLKHFLISPGVRETRQGNILILFS